MLLSQKLRQELIQVAKNTEQREYVATWDLVLSLKNTVL